MQGSYRTSQSGYGAIKFPTVTCIVLRSLQAMAHLEEGVSLLLPTCGLCDGNSFPPTGKCVCVCVCVCAHMCGV